MAIKDEYFTISEAAMELSVTRQTISRWITQGKLPAERIGREKLIGKKDLERYEEERLKEKIVPIILKGLVDNIRKDFQYDKEDVVELIEVNRVGAIAFSVTKKDGSQEKLWVHLGEVDFEENKHGINMAVKITRRRIKGTRKSTQGGEPSKE